MDVPVVTDDGDFAGLDTSASSASPRRPLRRRVPVRAAPPSRPTESPSASPSE